MSQETYGQRLQQLRTAKGWSQAHFAMVSGVSIGTLRNHEQDRGVMTVSQMFTYCQALDVSCEAFTQCVPGKPDKRSVKVARPRSKGVGSQKTGNRSRIDVVAHGRKKRP